MESEIDLLQVEKRIRTALKADGESQRIPSEQESRRKELRMGRRAGRKRSPEAQIDGQDAGRGKEKAELKLKMMFRCRQRP